MQMMLSQLTTKIKTTRTKTTTTRGGGGTAIPAIAMIRVVVLSTTNPRRHRLLRHRLGDDVRVNVIYRIYRIYRLSEINASPFLILCLYLSLFYKEITVRKMKKS